MARNVQRLNAVAVVGTFKDNKGKDKKEYLTIGTAWHDLNTGIINVDLKLPVGITEYVLFPVKAKDKK